MAKSRWNEERGLTLQLTSAHADERTDARFVRLAVVRRSGLLSRWFNVQEMRAERPEAEIDPLAGDASPHRLGRGRLLSWRWLARREADDLLGHRLETLQSLGYVVIDRSDEPRGEWAWLHELVQQQLEAAEGAGDPDDPEHRVQSLAEALERLGMDADAIERGIAQLLGLDPGALQRPDAATVAACDREQLAALLPFLLAHRDDRLRAVGERWLALPATAYELEPATVESWLRDDGPLARGLVSRLEREGLALLGSDALQRLAAAARRDDVRTSADAWARRLA